MNRNATGYGFNSHLRKIFIFLRSGIEGKRGVEFRHSMPPEFGGKWGTECLNTRFPLPTLLQRDDKKKHTQQGNETSLICFKFV